MKTISTLLLAFSMTPLAAFAVANFSGHWIANEGSVSSNIGLSSKCSKVEIIIEQNDMTVLTKKFQADCSLYGTHWGPIPQDIKDGKVYEAGEEVGTINESTLMTISHSGSAQYAYNLRLVSGPNGEVLMQSYYGTRTAAGAMATEATLHRVQP